MGATVHLTGTALAAPRVTRTEADGTFAFEQVGPGRYTLRIESAGFVTWSRDVTIVAGDVQVPVALQIAGFSENDRAFALGRFIEEVNSMLISIDVQPEVAIHQPLVQEIVLNFPAQVADRQNEI